MSFPVIRPRRLRKNELIRSLVRETKLTLDDLIYPLFVTEYDGVKKEIPSMPGIYQMDIENTVKECIELERLGIKAIILFGIPKHKDELGSEAYNENGIIQNAIRAIKQNTKNLYIITDVCMCEYTSHGHCGIIKDNDVNNDETLKYLALEALSHAKAGADMVAPSDMMDGRIMAIRDILDSNSFENIPIMSYSAKFASAYYGPFRDAAESTPNFGDRRSYQMDPANRLEAIRESELDLLEGADILMVKPALAYLDIIRETKDTYNVPLAAYNVSGEYSMIMGAIERGWFDKDRIILETLTSIKRAGADLILTYFAKEVAKIL
ncbi:MAG: Porphobilinogen synthase [Deferribacteraceae bacterium]|jgi:porphobilinogen synthase|nr:Porphobilinogen synthase [Deferribacteraceae bacterium]